MNQKGFANIALIVLVVVLLGVVGYFAIVKKSEPVAQQPTPSPVSNTQIQTPKAVNWESLIPTIRTAVGPTFLGARVEESGSLSIFQKNDITGDSISEALVSLGSGGAYTSYLTLMRVENDKPAVAQFKQKDGKISPLMFLAGASVMNGESVVMLSDKNAIYSGHWSRAVSGTSFGSLTNCSVEAYQWNVSTKTFDFSTSLGNEIRPDFCRNAEK